MVRSAAAASEACRVESRRPAISSRAGSLTEARTTMGEDFWPYGVEASRKTLESFLKHHHAQGLSSRLVKPEELFHPGTLEAFKI